MTNLEKFIEMFGEEAYRVLFNFGNADPECMKEIKEFLSHNYNDDSSWFTAKEGNMPEDYGHDWVLVSMVEVDTGFVPLPMVAEHKNGKWYDNVVNADIEAPFGEKLNNVVRWKPLFGQASAC